MADKSASDVLAEVITSAAERAVKNANFDVSSYGVITSKDGQHYTIAVFGGEYGIVTNHDYIVGQKVVVTAMQGNFRNLIVSESNTSVEILTVKSLVTGVDKLNTEFASFVDKSQQTEDTIQDQLKNTVNTWYRNGRPQPWLYPSSEWTTDDEKKNHINDIYYDKRTGLCYRWVYDQDKQQYFWMEIVDAGVINALSMAATARDLATEKIRIFTSTPTVPYDANDLWIRGGAGGELYICTAAKSETESYSFSDWAIATKYTDDTTANAAVKRISDLETKEAEDIKTLQQSIDGFNTDYNGFTYRDYKATKEQVVKNKNDISTLNNTVSELTVDNFMAALNLAVNDNGELCYIVKS